MDNDENAPAQQQEISDILLKKLTDLFIKNYKPVNTEVGSLLLTTQEITDKFADILPEITDNQVMTTLETCGFKTTMIKKSTGFDLYWMLKEK
ncbi:MAG: hypothetical protein A2X13_14765 [Bacteroidetes bacterium GWC2_33_15]|nr:MAG: hypothetical protein A2X10_06830 [Bacteroidetes bacterium GWA2_33_15]OFX50135.1 MAG: hypothetical protein A2X13_14765 [Bacteroidetes bacterium GWC2_33_15]OFX65288.1 MAG: hypothetical protein A2X15_04340 [Bacteroidetes bacterium GWB2_32_14]OFX70514.1 MAG: hypothetical protein A2X14_04395 [Bacteroidetes bacterium GWD2_33_33]HAN19613.1 hypothetical protein [Bacteroidales bacterium]